MLGKRDSMKTSMEVLNDLGVPALRRIAGVNAFNYNQLKTISDSKSILQTIIDLAQHQVIRAR